MSAPVQTVNFLAPAVIQNISGQVGPIPNQINVPSVNVNSGSLPSQGLRIMYNSETGDIEFYKEDILCMHIINTPTEETA